MNPIFKKTLIAFTLGASVAGTAWVCPAQASSTSVVSPAHTVSSGKYTVRKDETFWTISQKIHIPLQDLLAANPDKDPFNLFEGIVLNVPAAGQARPSSAPAPALAQAKEAHMFKESKISQAKTLTTASGETLAYSRAITAKATAYSDSPVENGPWGAVDYLGNPLQLGTIAVDPSLIPMGAIVYITGYDSASLPEGGMIAQATDQGGAIKGKRIDIFVPGSRDKAMSFGIQDVTVYVVKEGSK